MSQKKTEPTLLSPLEHHAKRRQELDVARSSVMRSASTVSTLRLVAVLGALCVGVAAGFGYLPPSFGYAVIAFLAAFVVLVVLHARLYRRLRRLDAALAYHGLAESRLTGASSNRAPRGDRFASDAHPYSADLGVFGPSSLFQLIDWTHTRLGEEILARWLAAPAPMPTILARQAAGRDLAEQWRLREEIAVEGALIAADRPDPEALLAWAEEDSQWQVRTARIAAWVVPLLSLVVMGASAFGVLSYVPAAIAFLGAWLVNFTFAGPVERIYAAVGPHTDALMRYQRILEILERASFTAPRLRELAAELSARSLGPAVPGGALPTAVPGGALPTAGERRRLWAPRRAYAARRSGWAISRASPGSSMLATTKCFGSFWARCCFGTCTVCSRSSVGSYVPVGARVVGSRSLASWRRCPAWPRTRRIIPTMRGR